MTTIADGIDFFQYAFLSKPTSHIASHQSGKNSLLGACYTMLVLLVVVMYDSCWRPSWRKGTNGFSFVYFVGSCFQFIGFLALCMNVKATKSVAGISSKSLTLSAINLSCRVFTTSIYEGYLPNDKSGDIMVQIVDGCSLVTILYLLYLVHKTYAPSYQEENDLSIKPIVVACVTSACFIRADLNHDLLFDISWALSMNIEIFQMLPQLYMLTKVGGVVNTTTAHYVVNIFMACVCRTAFWVWAIPGCSELAVQGGGPSYDMTMGGYYILSAHALEILVMLDFMFHYVRAWWSGSKSVYLPKIGAEELM